MSSTEWMEAVATTEIGWDFLQDLVDIGNRMAGSEGEREAATLTANSLNTYTRDIDNDSFKIQGWERTSSDITSDGSTLVTNNSEVIALPRSPSMRSRGQLVNLGFGLPRDISNTDLSGKVVIVQSGTPDWYHRSIHRREKYYRTVDSGAEAFIFQNGHEGRLPLTGSVGTPDTPLGEIPAVGVSYRVGEDITSACEGEEVTVAVDCDTPTAKSQNIHARMGPETEDRILITSHIDAHDISEGAVDNAAGTAILVEIAHLLSMRMNDIETQIEFVGFGAEEVGMKGSEYMSNNTDLGTIKAIINLDGVLSGRDLQFYTHGFDKLGDVVESVANKFSHPVLTAPVYKPHSDHWPFTRWGVPGYLVSSKSERSGRGWAHTPADTLDKLDIRDLREQALFLTELVCQLSDPQVKIAHKNPAEIADRLTQNGYKEAMQATGDWPYDT